MACSGLGIPPCVQRGDLEPGRLLQSVDGEEHVRRELAELPAGPARFRPQPGLGEGGGHEVGVHPLFAEGRAERLLFVRRKDSRNLRPSGKGGDQGLVRSRPLVCHPSRGR